MNIKIHNKKINTQLIGEDRSKANLEDQEKERERLEVEYKSLFDLAPDGIIKVDLKGFVTSCNEAFLKMTGYPREKIIGKHFTSLPTVRVKDVPKYVKIVASILTGRKIKPFEFEWIDKNGSTRQGEIHTALIKVNGRANGIMAVLWDITERNKAEEALRESEKKLSKVFHFSPGRIVITRLKDNEFIDVNDSYLKYTGYTRKEVIGKSAAELGHWVDPKQRLRLINTLKEGGEVSSEEVQLRIKSGEVCTSLFSAELIDIGGEPCMISVATDITERKRAEEALQESEEKFRLLTENSVMGTFIIQDSKMVYVNPGFAKTFGYTPEEIIDIMDPSAFIHPDDIDFMMQRLADRYAGKVTDKDISFRGIKKDGSSRFIEATAVLTEYKDKPAVMGTFIDVTERKRAEEALADEATRRRILVEQSRDGIVILDQDGKVYETNQRFAEMLGYSVEEVLQLSVWDWEFLYPPEQVKEMIGTVDEAGDHFETQHKRKDGSIYDVEISTNGAMFAGQKLIFCVCRDITERKKAETNLKQHKELIERILSTTPSAVLVIDKELKIGLVNRAFCDISKKSMDYLFGKSICEIIPSKELLKEISKAASSNESRINDEFIIKFNDQESLFIANILQMQEGEVLLILDDVTEERERQEKLYLTDRMASIGEMAAGIAHELNNPLTGVIGLSQLLSKEELPDDAKEDLDSIYNEARRAANIVKNLLTFARKHASIRKPTQINSVLDDVFNLRAYELKVHNITFNLNVDSNIPEIMADPYQLQQVFLNIVLNAEQAMIEAHGEGTLTVTTERINGNIKVSFSDSGPGIAPENVSKLFSPFFTTKEVGKGTGLGLSVCYGIVKNHGGRISAQSTLGKGSSFVVELPIDGHRGE